MAEITGMEQRLSQYIEYKTGGKRTPFAEQLGWSKQYLHKILKGENIGLSPVASLLQTFPDLNARWLLFGEGAMLEAQYSTVKRNLLNLLLLDEYIPVMTPAELKEVNAGKLEWDVETLAKWKMLSEQRKAQINAHFEKSYEKQKNNKSLQIHCKQN